MGKLYIEISVNTQGSPQFLLSLTLPPDCGQLREFRSYQKGGNAEMVLQSPGNAGGYTKVSELKARQMGNYCERAHSRTLAKPRTASCLVLKWL